MTAPTKDATGVAVSDAELDRLEAIYDAAWSGAGFDHPRTSRESLRVAVEADRTMRAAVAVPADVLREVRELVEGWSVYLPGGDAHTPGAGVRSIDGSTIPDTLAITYEEVEKIGRLVDALTPLDGQGGGR